MGFLQGKDSTGLNHTLKTTSSGVLNVDVQDPTNEPIDLYLYRTDQIPTLISGISVDDVTFSVNTTSGISASDVITIYEDTCIFQSIVVSTSSNTITCATPCDKPFTTDAIVHVGPWNMGVNGSGTSQIFTITPPSGASFDIYEIGVSGLDDNEMDATTFVGVSGGITNGILLRVTDGTTKNLGLFLNNLGLTEFGYTVTFVSANKKSQYGLIAYKNMRNINGVAIRLNGETGDKFEVWIRDDLSSQTLLAFIIKGHVVIN